LAPTFSGQKFTIASRIVMRRQLALDQSTSCSPHFVFVHSSHIADALLDRGLWLVFTLMPR